MVYKNGIFKTNLTKEFQSSRFTIRMECKSECYKELFIVLFDFVRKINTDNIYVVIKELQLLVSDINIDNCKVTIFAKNNKENLYVPVI